MNTPKLCYSYKEACAAVGYSDDWEKYTLCQSIYTCFNVQNVAPIILVNVLDPAVHKTAAQPEDAPAAEAAAPAEDTVPESTTDKLHHMAAELTLRCVLAGILAVVLLHLGLTAEHLLPPLSVLDCCLPPACLWATRCCGTA